MKISIWDILTGVVLMGILCMIGGFGAILMNPASAFNPLPPSRVNAGNIVATIALPTQTATSPYLPPTWTPSSAATKAQQQSAGTSPTLRPTSTPVPTFTPVILPTFTPSRAPRTGVGGGSCSVARQTPADGTFYLPNTDFDVTWQLKNNSNDTWRGDSVDIKFSSGDRMHYGNDARDMPYDVSAGSFLDLTVRMRTPGTPGGYTSNWQLVAGDRVLCQFFISIRVQ